MSRMRLLLPGFQVLEQVTGYVVCGALHQMVVFFECALVCRRRPGDDLRPKMPVSRYWTTTRGAVGIDMH